MTSFKSSWFLTMGRYNEEEETSRTVTDKREDNSSKEVNREEEISSEEEGKEMEEYLSEESENDNLLPHERNNHVKYFKSLHSSMSRTHGVISTELL